LACKVEVRKRPICSLPTREIMALLQPQAGYAKGQVGGAAAQVHGHAARVFQGAAELLGVQVHGQPAQAGQVDVAPLPEISVVSWCFLIEEL